MTVQHNTTRTRLTPTNAVRHGLAGTRHVPRERVGELRLIEQDLVFLHEPNDPKEMELVRDLSLATWQVGEHDRQHVDRVEVQTAMSADVFDAQEQARFRKLLACWRDDPVTTVDSLTGSCLGLRYLTHLWRSIAESLGPEGSGVSLEMAWEAVLAEGQQPGPAKIAGAGEWIMTRCLAASASPEETVTEWLERAGAGQSKNALARAKTLLSLAPSAETSRKELLLWANQKLEYWGGPLERRESDYELMREQFGSAGAGIGLGDEAMQRDARLANRYRVSAQNRLDKLVRRLNASKNERMKRNQKQYEMEQREKHRKQQSDYSLARMNDEEFRRYNEQLDYNAKREAMIAQTLAEQRAWDAGHDDQEMAEDGQNGVDGESGQMRIQTVGGAVLEQPMVAEVQVEVEEKAGVLTESEIEAKLGVEPVRRPRVDQPVEEAVAVVVNWEREVELVSGRDLAPAMFGAWPDELVMDRTDEVLARMLGRETEGRRRMRLGIYWMTEVNSREMRRATVR